MPKIYFHMFPSIPVSDYSHLMSTQKIFSKRIWAPLLYCPVLQTVQTKSKERT